MKEITINEFLRYFVIGVFFLMINFVSLTSHYKKVVLDLALPGTAIVFAISLFWGSFLYTVYRAIFYPIIFNPLMITILKERNTIDKSLKTSKVVFDTDAQRLQAEENKRKSLAEWAAQVHYLLNVGLCFLYVYAASILFDKYYIVNIWNLVSGVAVLIIGNYHLFRYKIFEKKILNKSISGSA